MLSQTRSEHPATDKVRDPELAYRLRQQTLLAEFGLYAVRTADVDALLQRATELCAQGMNAQLAKALEWEPQHHRLLVRAGVGWAEGVVGTATLSADLDSPAGFALHTGRPVISNHLAAETRFRTPQLLLDHGVKRAINVIVRGQEKGHPFGVLAVDSPSEGQFDEADIAFLQGFANLLGVAIERIRAETALRRSEESFRTLANSIPQLAWMANAEGWIFWYNDRWFDYTGTTLEEMEGWGWRKVHHPDHVEQVVERITHAWETGEPWEDTFPLRGKDGRYRWFLSRALPIRDDEGRVVRWFGTNTDVTERREAEERQALLTREISHRVKNSLQIVAGLLGMQARAAKHDEVRYALEDARTRVYTIAQVHDHLWKRGEVTTIDLAEFLASLCAGLQATAPRHRLVYEAKSTIPVPTDRAVPVGLLLNELVTNAFKYAYPAGTGGDVRVHLSRPDPGRIRLEVADSGQGLPAGFDLERPNSSLGLRLIDAFTRQLEGSIQALSAEPGARFIVDVPYEHES